MVSFKWCRNSPEIKLRRMQRRLFRTYHVERTALAFTTVGEDNAALVSNKKSIQRSHARLNSALRKYAFKTAPLTGGVLPCSRIRRTSSSTARCTRSQTSRQPFVVTCSTYVHSPALFRSSSSEVQLSGEGRYELHKSNHSYERIIFTWKGQRGSRGTTDCATFNLCRLA